MSDRGPAVTAATATRDVADSAPSLAGPRPFSRPMPASGDRSTPTSRPGPFVAAFEPQRAPRPAEPAGEPARPAAAESEPTASSTSASERAVAMPAARSWPQAAELDAAHALDALVRRLRVGSLRLPVTIDPACPSAVLAAVLAALHADASAEAAERSA